MDVGAWLRGLGLGRYELAFRSNDIDVAVLHALTADDLREIGVTSLGHRKRLLDAIGVLGSPDMELPQPPQEALPPRAERRQITVMFIDLVGSTALSSRLDPEDMREILHAYQNAVTGEIVRTGGCVAKLMGDGVLAYFGWPRAEEDDAERAVLAGLAIVHIVKGLSTPIGEPLAARVGIATGLVVVGDLIGEGSAREEAVIGETPNLAARLQEIAPAGGVVIAPGTRQLLGEVFCLRDLGLLLLKGFERPVHGFEVIRPQRGESRFEAHRSDRSMPMVGRDRELEHLLARWAATMGGKGQGILVIGEAGIGKSRLVQAMLDHVASDPHFALRYQCSPHYTGTSFWPVIQQLGFAAGIGPDDSDEVKLDKLETLLRQGAEDISEAAPLIADLLGIEARTRYPPQELSARQRRARTEAVLIRQLRGLERRQPVLIVVEDAHWSDPTTLELFGQVLEQVAGARVLMLLTSRPDHVPNLDMYPQVTRLTLDRLDRGSTDAIVGRLSGSVELMPAMRDEIAARTDGVPLFVEELTKAVLEAGMTLPEGVPVSLHASLLARLDRVPGAREVAQVAACIGREFSYALLVAVSPVSQEELEAALARLAAAELLFRHATPLEVRYAFKHALVRDAAYGSLLKSRRQDVHNRIARALEEHFPETVHMVPELLARHYTEAGRARQAIEYWYQAGQQALARSAMAEAVAHLSEGLAVLQGLPDGPDRHRDELRLQLALGQASIAGKGFAAAETGRAYARAQELCRQLGDAPEIFPVLYGRSVFHFQRGELNSAYAIARELLRLGRKRKDVSGQLIGRRMIGSALSQMGRFAQSRDAFETALALYDPVRDRNSGLVYAIDSRVMCLSWLSHLNLILGDPDQAMACSNQVSPHLAELDHPGTTAVALAWGCIFHQLCRNPHAAQAQAAAAMALATEQGFPLYRAMGAVVHGWAQVESGQVVEGIREMHAGLDEYRSTDAVMWVPYFQVLLAGAYGQEGRAAEGIGLVDEALAQVQRTGGRWIESDLYRTRGELLLTGNAPDLLAAERCFLKALDVARKQDARLWELRAVICLARLRRDQGQGHVAFDLLSPILSRLDELPDCMVMQSARELFDSLKSCRHNDDRRG